MGRAIYISQLCEYGASCGVAAKPRPSAPPAFGKGITPEKIPNYMQELLREQQMMLDQAGAYTSEELAAAVGSNGSSSGELAAAQRNAGKVFGVRFGPKWLYPKFQFNARSLPIPEMKEVLTALSPDDKGWDRLQWFLEPHEELGGSTPLEVWANDRQKVIDAAKTERWGGRD